MSHGKVVLLTEDNEFNGPKLGGAAHLLPGLAGVKSTNLHFFSDFIILHFNQSVFYDFF